MDPHSKSWPALRSLLSATALLIAAPGAALTIDDFGAEVSPTTSDVFVTEGNPIGGELDAIIVRPASYQQTGGKARFTQDSVMLVYDGVDGSAANQLGLGGVDLTDGGASGLLRLALPEVTGHNSLVLKLFTSETEVSAWTSSRITSAHTLLIPWSNFIQAFGAAAPADPTRIDRIELLVRVNQPDGGIAIDSIASVPEPGTATLLLLGLGALAGVRRQRTRSG